MAKKKDEISQINNVDDIINVFNRKFGEGSLKTLSSRYRVDCEVISSGSLALDGAMGVGGYPKGRIIEIFGPEASGKTTLALHVVANVQKDGGTAAYIDAEHALDPKYMHKLGVDLDSLLLGQPDCGEQALDMVDLLIDTHAVDVIIIDSVAALVPRSELEGEVGDNSIGAQARMMSQFLRRAVPKIKNSGTTVVFINQIRHKIGVMFGNPETTSGGNAMKFYASMRIDIRRRQTIKRNDEVIGHIAKVKVIKNKVATPFKTCDVSIIYGIGIDNNIDIIELGYKYKILSKSGSWYSYKDQRIGNGIEAATTFLKDNDDIRNNIIAEVKEHLFDAPIINEDEVSEDGTEAGE